METVFFAGICIVLAVVTLGIYWRWQREKRELLQRQEALAKESLTKDSAIRDLFFTRVVTGGYFTDAAHLTEAGKAVGVEFPYDVFLVVTARLETWGELFQQGQMDRLDLNFILRNVLQNSFPGRTEAADVSGTMVAILNMEQLPESGLRGLVQDARRALEVLEAEFGITITVAISRVYHSPMDLSEAFLDTQHVLEYRQLMGEDYPVTTYEELTHRYIRQSGTSFLEMEKRLLGCVRNADFSGMRVVLHELISNEFGETKPTVDIFRFRVYGVVNTLLYLMNDIRSVVGDELIEELDPGPRLTSAKTLSDIVREMDDILDSLEARVAQKRQPTPPAWVERVRTFVCENFRDPNLTVSYTADEFGMTPTYCSKVFREQFGIRLFDFIQLQRLEAAKAQMSSGKSLKEIAEEVGFSSALTMSRAFKRYEGVSPSNFREQI